MPIKSYLGKTFGRPPLGIRRVFKGELQRENKLISYERALKVLENDMYITVIGQAVLELLSFDSDQGITKRQSPYFRNFR